MEENLLSNFREIVLEDAERASRDKIARQEEKIKKLADEYEESTFGEEEGFLKKEMAGIEEKYREMAGEAEIRAKRELIDKRCKMEQEIRDLLKKRLAEFSASEQYKTYLKNKAYDAIKIAGEHNVIAEVRETDRQILEGIVSVRTVAEDYIGGARFIIPQKGIIIDNTLKSALEDVISGFHEIKISKE